MNGRHGWARIRESIGLLFRYRLILFRLSELGLASLRMAPLGGRSASFERFLVPKQFFPPVVIWGCRLGTLHLLRSGL